MLRADLAESWHHGAAAVVTPEGRLVARVGSETVETFLRSAAKPFQAVQLLRAGGIERFGLSDEDLALICSSHHGTEVHTERVAALLSRGGLAVGDLACGAHWPFDSASRERLRRAGEQPTSLHNNCSGKHAGLLLSTTLYGEPVEGYLDPGHPLQRRILADLATISRVEEEAIGLGVDGCSTLCFRTSLDAAARGYAALADPCAAGLGEAVAEALTRIAAAMAAAPAMVAGPGTFTTRLIEVTGGRVLGKEGTEGLYAVAVRGPVALGLVLKVADGSDRARPGVVLDLLRQLGSLSAAELAELEEFHRPEILSVRGDPVGHIEPGVELETLDAAGGALHAAGRA